MDIETIQSTIKEFAEKYNFLQEIDIEKVETSVFNRQNYRNIDGKNFISINKYDTKIVIEFGKINIEIDSIDEDDLYWIDKNILFSLNVLDFSNKDDLIDAILMECTKLNYTDQK